MYFTREDYKKIQKWLLDNAIKDTEFDLAVTPLQGEETVVFVQNGQNVRVYLKDLAEQLIILGGSDLVNVSSKYNAYQISLAQAISYIPYMSRQLGQLITFNDTDNKWRVFQFRGERVNQWNNTTLWIDIIQGGTGKSVVPDEEDLTWTEQGPNMVLKFKDRRYNPNDFSGLGMKILRKNIVQGVNILQQTDINQENTIYEIRYDFDLMGQTINIPSNSVLNFTGGSFKNGTIIGSNTLVYGKGLYDTVILDGTFSDVNVKNYKQIDDISLVANLLLNVIDTVYIPDGTYSASQTIELGAYKSLIGQSLSTIINVTAPDNFISMSTYNFGRTIANLNLVGTGSQDKIPGSGNYIPGIKSGTSNQIAIYMTEAHETHIYNVRIQWFMRAINISLNCWETSIHHTYIYNCSQGIYQGNWVREENMMKYERVSCTQCDVGYQLYNGYLQTLSGCRAELCNTGFRVAGSGQFVFQDCYFERNHNRSVWIQNCNGRISIQNGYFALSEYQVTWEGKPNKINDIFFDNSPDCYMVLENCWFNPLGDSLPNKEGFYIVNINPHKPMVVRNCIFEDNIGYYKLKFIGTNNFWDLLSKGDYKPINASHDNWKNISVSGDILDLTTFPIMSQNIRITSISGNTQKFIELKMPIVQDSVKDGRYESLIYGIEFSNAITNTIDYIKITNIAGTSYVPVNYILLKSSKNRGGRVYIELISPLADGAQWKVYSDDWQIYDITIPSSYVPKEEDMSDEYKTMYKGHRVFSKDSDGNVQSIYFTGVHWVNEEGTLISKVVII